ncbi:MAG: hypothetical protein OSB10_10940, partial [Planctomycetota bacterium]|nr:hypothetical protein [Planctomycetota bacterium]
IIGTVDAGEQILGSCGINKIRAIHGVAQKAGAIHEGRQKKRLILHGLNYDAEMYAICRD